jgi:hypothetical protein
MSQCTGAGGSSVLQHKSLRLCHKWSLDAVSTLGRAVQDARECGGHLVRLDRLGEKFADAGGE